MGVRDKFTKWNNDRKASRRKEIANNPDNNSPNSPLLFSHRLSIEEEELKAEIAELCQHAQTLQTSYNARNKGYFSSDNSKRMGQIEFIQAVVHAVQEDSDSSTAPKTEHLNTILGAYLCIMREIGLEYNTWTAGFFRLSADGSDLYGLLKIEVEKRIPSLPSGVSAEQEMRRDIKLRGCFEALANTIDSLAQGRFTENSQLVLRRNNIRDYMSALPNLPTAEALI